MARITLLFAFLVLLLSADEGQHTYKSNPYGFGYIAAGLQTSLYTLDVSISGSSGTEEFQVETTNSSMYYATGSMVYVSPSWDFQVSAQSTLLSSTSATNYQDTSMGLLMSNVTLDLYYKFNNFHSMLLGVDYEYDVTKIKGGLRSGTLIDYDTAILSLETGYMYRNKLIAGSEGWHYRFGASVGLPALTYSSTTSSGVIGSRSAYNVASGFKANAFGYMGYAILQGLEIGVHAQYLYRYLDTGYTLNVRNPGGGRIGDYTVNFGATKLDRFSYLLTAVYNF